MSTRRRPAKNRCPGDWHAAYRPNPETEFKSRFAARPRIGPCGPGARRMKREFASRSRIASRQAGSRSAIRAMPGDIVALPDAPRFPPSA